MIEQLPPPGLVAWVQSSEPWSGQVLGPVVSLEIVVDVGMEHLFVPDHLYVFLGYVGHLRRRPVPRVNQDSVVGLVSPMLVITVHLF